MVRQVAGSQQNNPFRRPVSCLLCVLSFFAALYLCVFFSYFHTAHVTQHNNPSQAQAQAQGQGQGHEIIGNSQSLQQQRTETREHEERSVKMQEQEQRSPVASRMIPGIVKASAASHSNQSVDLEGLNDLVTAVVECQTSHGSLVIDVREKWAPLGAHRYLELVESGLFTDLPFFRVCPRYITQFGVRYGWNGNLKSIPDDPSLWGKRDMNFGYLFFAVIDLSQ